MLGAVTGVVTGVGGGPGAGDDSSHSARPAPVPHWLAKVCSSRNSQPATEQTPTVAKKTRDPVNSVADKKLPATIRDC